MADVLRNRLDQQGMTVEERKQAGLLLGCHGTVIHPPSGIRDTGYRDITHLYQHLEEEQRGIQGCGDRLAESPSGRGMDHADSAGFGKADAGAGDQKIRLFLFWFRGG